MAYCVKCGNQIEDGINFCPACGAQQQVAQPEQAPASEPAPTKSDEEKLQNATNTIDSTAQKIGNTADYTDKHNKTDVEANKAMAVLSYFGFLVFIPILAAKESPFARFHANQGLLLFVGIVAYTIVDIILTAIFGAIFIRGLHLWSLYSILVTIVNLLYIGFTVLAIIGIINALNGRARELPIIGKYRLLK